MIKRLNSFLKEHVNTQSKYFKLRKKKQNSFSRTMKLIRTLARNVRSLSGTKVLASEKLFVHRETPENNIEMNFEFSPEFKKRAAEIIAKYPPQYKKGAVMPLLDLGQRQEGFTSVAVMNHIAKLLEMAPMRVYEVATFYTMYNRDPVGKVINFHT